MVAEGGLEQQHERHVTTKCTQRQKRQRRNVGVYTHNTMLKQGHNPTSVPQTNCQQEEEYKKTTAANPGAWGGAPAPQRNNFIAKTGSSKVSNKPQSSNASQLIIIKNHHVSKKHACAALYAQYTKAVTLKAQCKAKAKTARYAAAPKYPPPAQ